MVPLLMAIAFAMPAFAQFMDAPLRPITTDSRIKTFVYNESDVYALLTHYGYQMNIEFGLDEVVDTISLGDRVGWQVIPAGRRLFIQAMNQGAHTNMTVVTNKRAYQFDLRSADATNPEWNSLTYVVRFYYPDPRKLELAETPPTLTYPLQPAPPPAPPVMQAPQAAMPTYQPQPVMPTLSAPAGYGMLAPSVPTQPAFPQDRAASANVLPQGAYRPYTPNGGGDRNLRYSFTGTAALAPIEMYDDGMTTYLRFAGPYANNPPVIYAVDGRGERPLPALKDGEYVVVQGVYPRLNLRKNAAVTEVYNDLLVGPAG